MPVRRSGRRGMLVSRRRSRGFKRYRSLYDPTPFKLTTVFRAWFPGDYRGTNTMYTPWLSPVSFFTKTVSEETFANITDQSNYSSAIFGPAIAARIIADNNITKSLLQVYNLFCLKGVAIRCSCSRPCNPNARATGELNGVNSLPDSQNMALCLYWGKTLVTQLPAPAANANQSLYEIIMDQDKCFPFQISVLANRPASRYYRAEYDSMGLGGKTYDSVEKFTSLPFAVQIASQAPYFTASLTPIIDINFDFYVTFKDKNG